jgi:hypothetical protein
VNPFVFLALVLGLFTALALYYALKYPSGKWFGTRRDKLLRKTGPTAEASLQNLTVRFLSRAGGQPRLMLNAIYGYSVKEQSHQIVLPLESSKLPDSGIQSAQTSLEFEREIPERLELQGGQALDGREDIRVYFLERLRQKCPTVTVIYDKKNPNIGVVRDFLGQ